MRHPVGVMNISFILESHREMPRIAINELMALTFDVGAHVSLSPCRETNWNAASSVSRFCFRSLVPVP